MYFNGAHVEISKFRYISAPEDCFYFSKKSQLFAKVPVIKRVKTSKPSCEDRVDLGQLASYKLIRVHTVLIQINHETITAETTETSVNSSSNNQYSL